MSTTVPPERKGGQSVLEVFLAICSFVRGALKWLFSHHRPIWLRITAAATLVYFGHHFLCDHKTVYVDISWRDNKGFNFSFGIDYGEESVVNNIEATYLEEHAMKYHRIHNPREWFTDGTEIQEEKHDLDQPCDIVDELPYKFLRNFKNPCWYENGCGCEQETPVLRCLPYFYLIGMARSGTTDLWNKILMHPEIINGRKEHNYWSYGRHKYLIGSMESEDSIEEINQDIEDPRNNSYFSDYIQGFDSQVAAIMRHTIQLDDGGEYHHRIIGEGSSTYMYGNMGLKLATTTDNADDYHSSNCTIPKVISNITPFSKFIIILRDPVQRLYSDYRQLWKRKNGREKSPQDFHEECEKAIKLWNECIKEHELEYCIYDRKFHSIAIHSNTFGLARGIYSAYLKEWFYNFRREQILILHENERNETKTFKQIYRFLELDPVPTELLDEIIHKKTVRLNRRMEHQQPEAEEMLQKTEDLLRSFYEPFNYELSELLNDERFLWRKVKDWSW